MADRIPITEACIAYQFEPRRYTNEEGYPAADLLSPVGVTTADGRNFVLPIGVKIPDGEDEPGYGYYERYDAERMLEKVRARGSIDPDAWVQIEPHDINAELGPFGNEWEREQYNRMGWPS